MAVANQEQLKRLVLDGKCVAFVGSGLSAPPGLPWLETVKAIADACGIPFEFEGKTEKERRALTERCPEIIDECEANDSKGYAKALRNLWPQHVNKSSRAIGSVLRLPFSSILTTNFDPWTHQQARSAEYRSIQSYPELRLHRGLDKRIFYIHGCFNADDVYADTQSLVFGKQSFEEAYGEASLLPGFLLHVFTFKNVVFLGFTPTEPHIARILSLSARVRRKLLPFFKGEIPQRFILIADPGDTSKQAQAEHEEYIENLRALEIMPIPFLRKGSDYRGLEELLAGWVDEGDISKRSPAFEEEF